MGFMVMVLSMILGITFSILGISNLKKRNFNTIFNVIILAIGVICIIFSIWLGFPK